MMNQVPVRHTQSFILPKLTLLTVMLFNILNVFAHQIDGVKAAKMAEAFLGKQVEETSSQMLSLRWNQLNDSHDYQPLYIFNAMDGQGFVVVAGDDRVTQILAYSDTGFLDPATAPSNVRWLLDSYVTFLESSPLSESALRTNESRPEIAPLLATQWGQGWPYNSLCPLVDGDRCLTGCVATAMAQIVKHHCWPQNPTSAVPGYQTTSHHIPMAELPPTRFNWGNITNEDIAKLMLYCGQAVKMDYDVNTSGASSQGVAGALRDIFGFGSGVSYINRSGYSDDEWDEVIYTELTEGRPVFYSGQSAEGGHAFVVDGYSKGRYHVDWGWEGVSNGYFTLTNLNNFNSLQGAVVNACPPAGSSNYNRAPIIATSIKCSERTLEREARGQFPDFNVVCALLSDLTVEAQVDVALALVSESGIMKVFAENTRVFQPEEEYVFESTISLGNLSDGDYRFVSICRNGPDEEWRQSTGATLNYISIKVEDSLLHLMPLPRSEEDLAHIDYGYHMIDGLRYHLYSEYSVNFADIVGPRDEEEYGPNIYVPDFVMYQNMKFDLYGLEAFHDLANLTSLSIGSHQQGYISNCENLKFLELREGLTSAPDIQNCRSLQTITYPSSATDLGNLGGCDSLRTIHILTDKQAKFPIYVDDSSFGPTSMPLLTDMYFYSVKPPRRSDPNGLLSPTFPVNPNVTIHIPSGSHVAYAASMWKDWRIEDDLGAYPIKVEWDYCGKDEGCGWGMEIGRGDNDVEFSIRIPQNYISPYKGKKITAIEYFTPDPAVQDWILMNVEYVFITSPGVDYVVKQSAKTALGSWTTVKLSEPYIITGDELFVGVGRHGALWLNVANKDMVTDGFWLRHMGSDPNAGESGVWTRSKLPHPLPIRAIIEGEDLPTDIIARSLGITEDDDDVSSLQPCSPMLSSSTEATRSNPYRTLIVDGSGRTLSLGSLTDNNETTPAEAKKLRVKMINRSPKTVYEILLGLTVDGEEIEPYVYNEGLMTNQETTVEIDLPINMSGRLHDLEVSVKSIDGEPDMIPDNNKVEETYTTPPTVSFPRRIVVEEATGTWCGFCPSAMAKIERMKESYRDHFIALAIHDDSDMPVSDRFDPFFANVNGYPTLILNRTKKIDDLEREEIEGLINSAEVSVESAASFLAGSQNKTIEVTTQTVFGFNDSGVDKYKLAYLIVEDEVGPYRQTNYFSDISAPDDSTNLMNWWIHQGKHVDIKYDDVVREIYNDYYGVEGSLPDIISINEENSFSHTLQAPDNVQNASNLRVVTLVLDGRTGEIMNAHTTPIDGIDGIEELQYDNVRIEVDGNGVSVVGLQPGQKGELYDIYGVMLQKGTSDPTGQLRLSMSIETPGVYILKLPSKTYKLTL